MSIANKQLGHLQPCFKIHIINVKQLRLQCFLKCAVKIEQWFTKWVAGLVPWLYSCYSDHVFVWGPTCSSAPVSLQCPSVSLQNPIIRINMCRRDDLRLGPQEEHTATIDARLTGLHAYRLYHKNSNSVLIKEAAATAQNITVQYLQQIFKMN